MLFPKCIVIGCHYGNPSTVLTLWIYRYADSRTNLRFAYFGNANTHTPGPLFGGFVLLKLQKDWAVIGTHDFGQNDGLFDLRNKLF